MSFIYAVRGVLASIRTEENLRFHLIIANLIILFAYFYGLSRVEWGILLIVIALMISIELLNTAVENAVDTATDEYRLSAKLAKDAGAGAVLVMAIASVAVGICLFGNTAKISSTVIHIFTTPKILIPSTALGIADILFLIFGGKNVKKI